LYGAPTPTVVPPGRGHDRIDDEFSPQDGYEDEAFRKVTLGLEVTGDDMTGLLLNIRLLQRELHRRPDGTEPGSHLQDMVSEVALACLQDPSHYHGCDSFQRYCAPDRTRRIGSSFDDDRAEICPPLSARPAKQPRQPSPVDSLATPAATNLTPLQNGAESKD